MSDSSQSTSPFPTAGYEMFEKMWNMMTNSPFAAFTGGMPSMMAPSISRLSEMAAPLTNPDELDKRITDMRAIEQWLKLNTGMLQSTIQALEVQRATLSTLKAFGALAQSSMDSAAQVFTGGHGEKGAGASAPTAASPFEALQKGWPMGAGWPGAATDGGGDATNKAAGAAAQVMDPSAWWNMLQTQFNQLAALAMPAQGGAGDESHDKDKDKGAERTGTSKPASSSARQTTGAAAKKSATRTSARKS